MGYFKTTVRAGATIEVTKSYTKRIGVKIKKDREKPTAEEMEKVNQMNAERTLRLKINANFGVDDPFITLTYRKDERPTPKQAKKNIKKVIDSLRKEFKKLGAGEAAIYHVVDILACTSESVKIEAKITIDTGYTWEDLLASAQEKIDGYFLELAKSWENEQNITVRILKVNAAIASVEGIIDVQNTALNGREENLLLDPNAIPVRGVILCKQ